MSIYMHFNMYLVHFLQGLIKVDGGSNNNTEPVQAYEVVVLDLAWVHDLLTGRRVRWQGSTEKEREVMAGRSLAEDLLLFHLIPTVTRGRC
jgi:hypothetical protein